MKLIGTKRLETERLILRKINNNDAKKMYENWASDPEVSKYLPWEIHENIDITKTLIDSWVLDYEKLSTFRWVVEHKKNGDIIGTIDVVKKSEQDNTCEIGYCYGKAYWNKGYASEALKKVLEFLFNDVDFRLIEARHIKENMGSGQVMLKSGMKLDAVLRERSIIKESKKVSDILVYSITKEEFEKK